MVDGDWMGWKVCGRMTDSMKKAQAVIDKVKAELTPIWLGGRQRMMLEKEIAAALDAMRREGKQEGIQETWEKAAELIDRRHNVVMGLGYNDALTDIYELCRQRGGGG